MLCAFCRRSAASVPTACALSRITWASAVHCGSSASVILSWSWSILMRRSTWLCGACGSATDGRPRIKAARPVARNDVAFIGRSPSSATLVLALASFRLAPWRRAVHFPLAVLVPVAEDCGAEQQPKADHQAVGDDRRRRDRRRRIVDRRRIGRRGPEI